LKRILWKKSQQLLFREILALILSHFTLQNCRKYYFKKKRGYQAQQHNYEKYFSFYTVTGSFFSWAPISDLILISQGNCIPRFGTFVRFVTIRLKFCIKRPDYDSSALGEANPCGHPACIFVREPAVRADSRLTLPKLHLTTFKSGFEKVFFEESIWLMNTFRSYE